MNTHPHLENLSDGAVRVLRSLLHASEENGDDFGLSGSAYAQSGMTSQTFAAHWGHLENLGWVFDWVEDLAADPGVACNEVQFGLTDTALNLRGKIS